MNPLDLRGPEFLVFFTIYGILIWGILEFLQADLEKSNGPLPRLTDPYAIGYLRAGVRGALQVAIVSLVNRGLVSVNDDRLVCETRGSAAPHGSSPLEREVLKAAKAGLKPPEVVRDKQIVACCLGTIEPELADSQLIPDESQKIRRHYLFASALALLALLAFTKILVAWGRGRHNIGFLIIEAIVLTFLLLHTMRRLRTRKGTEVLNSLAGLFGHLKGKSNQPKKSGCSFSVMTF